MRQTGWRMDVKHVLDVVGAALLALVTLPLQLGAAVAVWITMGSPILFRQSRAGRHGRPFQLVKLRSMSAAVDSAGRLLPDEQRLTRTGRFLRATSLDELPQLWNVLTRDLSLVGPRPLFTAYLARYTPEQLRRHDVLPGITGWSQINGRNDIDWTKKFDLDLWYVNHWSLWLDLRILCLTPWRVLRMKGISRHAHATAPEYMGSNRA